MTRALKGHILQDSRFTFPFRMILAGSSESGKTYFAGRLLEKPNLFEDKISAVFYYYPCYLSEAPVTWHKTLDIPVSYHIGLPSMKELANLPKQSCVVIDDSFDEAIKSPAIDHLFRVISGKKKICVMIMTQNNFTKGKYGREIRNSCNYSVLFRNCCDVSINANIARMVGLKHAFCSASLEVEGSKYPYFFLDQSQKGQLTQFRLYTDIFSKNMVTWSLDGMKAYVVGAQDFELFFKVISEGRKFTAKENVDEKSEECPRSITISESQLDPKQQAESKKSPKPINEISEHVTENSTQDSPASSKVCNDKFNHSTSESSESEHDDADIVQRVEETNNQKESSRFPKLSDEPARRTGTTRPIRSERFFRRQRFRRII